VKILGGAWRGRPLAQPKTSAVRPLSDKLRAAIFDITGPLQDLTVLDVYAGSGAAGLEALSRGALLVEAIEANSSVCKVIQANARGLGADFSYLLHHMTVATWLASPQQQPAVARYDLIIADPPYAQLEDDILERLLAYLKPEGMLVVSHGGKRPSPVLKSGELVRAKIYGDSALSCYQQA
jgi:16S rRNA (guanine966-N2)-methyltransferase